MKRLKLIWILSLLLFFVAELKAQDNAQGNVVVHSDPRLSLLVSKPHNMEVTASNITKHKPAVVSHQRSVEISTTAVKNKPSKNIAISTSAPVLSNSNTKTIKQGAVKVSSAEASTPGHAGGWTPPMHRKARSVSSGKGFRVQIYNGPDRSKAIERKTEFMRNYPSIRTYLTYIAPCFRVKVGDYRNRNEAIGMLKEANSAYSPCMIVPDIINISTF